MSSRRSQEAPVELPLGGEDTYENLVLLCPTHHTEVDKSPPEPFPQKYCLIGRVGMKLTCLDAFTSPTFHSQNEIADYILRLLIENRAVWKTYGPESIEAQSNPISNLASIWPLRKLDTIVPNNRKIIEAVRKNSALLTSKLTSQPAHLLSMGKGSSEIATNGQKERLDSRNNSKTW